MKFETFIKDWNQPVVFRNLVNEWPASKWTLQYLAHYLKDREIKCKIGPKFQGVFETECLYLDVTISDFIDWCCSNSKSTNPLYQIDKDQYFCYLDYKYMVELFPDNEEILQSIDWSVFGLYNHNGNDSTIWIGSQGCTTPCHYDTYGFNLVAQISGSKRWYLFPPSDLESLYPTRIPYEESSVFSEVNITHPDFNRHPLFKECHPYKISLEAGDVLYVPKHWWHYVECLDTAISVNTWVEMADDNETRVKEAITRILVSSLKPSYNDTIDSLVNPTETLQSNEVNLKYFQKAVESLVTCSNTESDPDQNKDSKPLLKEHKDCESNTTSNKGALQDSERGDSVSNKFQQFCDKFQSWKVHEFKDINKINSDGIRKLNETDFLQSEKQKFLKTNTSEQTSPKITDNKCIVQSDLKDSSSSEIVSETILSKSVKATTHIFAVPKCNLSELSSCVNNDPKSGNPSRNMAASGSVLVGNNLIKSILNPQVIDTIFEEFKKLN